MTYFEYSVVGEEPHYIKEENHEAFEALLDGEEVYMIEAVFNDTDDLYDHLLERWEAEGWTTQERLDQVHSIIKENHELRGE